MFKNRAYHIYLSKLNSNQKLNCDTLVNKMHVSNICETLRLTFIYINSCIDFSANMCSTNLGGKISYYNCTMSFSVLLLK